MARAKIFDLGKLAHEMRRRGNHPDLVDGIMNQLHFSSRKADLSHASDLLALLDEMAPARAQLRRDGPEWPRYTNTQGALLAQAIVPYVRASGIGDKGRGVPFKIKKAFNAEERALHEKARILRDRAIAHFDSEDRQDWHADSLALIRFEDGSWTYGSPQSRTTYRSEVHAELKVVAGALNAYLERLGEETMDALNTQLQAAIASDPSLGALIDSLPFDDVAFFGASPQAAAATERLHRFGEGEFIWHTNVPVRSSA